MNNISPGPGKSRAAYAGGGVVCVACCAKAGSGILYSRSAVCRGERQESPRHSSCMQGIYKSTYTLVLVPYRTIDGYPRYKCPRFRELDRDCFGSDGSGYPPPGTRFSVRQGATLHCDRTPQPRSPPFPSLIKLQQNTPTPHLLS